MPVRIATEEDAVTVAELVYDRCAKRDGWTHWQTLHWVVWHIQRGLCAVLERHHRIVGLGMARRCTSLGEACTDAWHDTPEGSIAFIDAVIVEKSAGRNFRPLWETLKRQLGIFARVAWVRQKTRKAHEFAWADMERRFA